MSNVSPSRNREGRPNECRRWLVAGLASAALVLWFVPTLSGDPQPVEAGQAQLPASPVDCLRPSPNARDDFSDEARRRRIAACREAHRVAPDDPQIQLALAMALSMDDRSEKVALFRAAAAQENAEANYQLYEHHKSWDRHSDRPPLVTRAEAEAGLRRAAEHGHADATFMLAVLLDRGGTVKRDAAQARHWAAQSAEHPPASVPRADILVLLGRLLAASDQADERARGRALLERLTAQGGAYDAATHLAGAIRADDPVRARKLLEAHLRSDPGGATPPLAAMLIGGEGGPPDPARALKLLRATNEIGAIHGALGQLYLEGRLVPKDVAKAVELIRHAGVWNVEARLQVMKLLAEHPAIRIDRPEIVRYDALEAAELGEPGGLAAAVALLLSDHPQFRDVAAGCRLTRLAVARGETLADGVRAVCPAP